MLLKLADSSVTIATLQRRDVARLKVKGDDYQPYRRIRRPRGRLVSRLGFVFVRERTDDDNDRGDDDNDRGDDDNGAHHDNDNHSATEASVRR